MYDKFDSFTSMNHVEEYKKWLKTVKEHPHLYKHQEGGKELWELPAKVPAHLEPKNSWTTSKMEFECIHFLENLYEHNTVVPSIW